MWRNYLTVGLRSLTRSRAFATINIFGLGIGIAACLLLLIYVRHELSYDRWIAEHQRVFQVQTESVGSEGSGREASQLTAFAAAEAMRGGFRRSSIRSGRCRSGP